MLTNREEMKYGECRGTKHRDMSLCEQWKKGKIENQQAGKHGP